MRSFHGMRRPMVWKRQSEANDDAPVESGLDQAGLGKEAIGDDGRCGAEECVDHGERQQVRADVVAEIVGWVSSRRRWRHR